MRKMNVLWIGLASAALACAHGGASSGPFVAAGGVASSVGSAAFSKTQVRGPHIELDSDGSGDWEGTFRDIPVDVTVHGKHIAGTGMTVYIDNQPNHVTITGQVNRRMFRFEVTPEVLKAVTDTRSGTFPRSGEHSYGMWTVTGEAAAPNPPEPAFAFALIGAFL